ERAHARSRAGQLEHPHPPAGLAPLHHVLEAPLVSLGVAAEDRREELLRLHATRARHRCSSQAAAATAPALVRPTTWMPTGRPLTGAGRVTTGWPVVLKGRVKRESGSRTS